MSTQRSDPPRRRMGAAERRALVLEAAGRAFARDGFSGTSTDAVAREAGVSQPYVVRIFGTKLELFVEVFHQATDAILAAFEAVIAERPFDPDSDEDWQRLGKAYTDLVSDRNVMLVLMHGFAAGGVPEIGVAARDGMGRIYELILTTGCAPDDARDFLARGMLMNVLLAMGGVDHLDEECPLPGLTKLAFAEGIDSVTP